MHLPSASLGLNVKGLRGFPVIGFSLVLFCFILTEDMLKPIWGSAPPNRSFSISLTLNLRFLVLGVYPKAVE